MGSLKKINYKRTRINQRKIIYRRQKGKKNVGENLVSSHTALNMSQIGPWECFAITKIYSEDLKSCGEGKLDLELMCQF